MVTENRLNLARKYLEDAKMLFQDGRWNSTIGRAYYASYQAMWSALGEPKEGSEKCCTDSGSSIEGNSRRRVSI